MRHSGLRLPSPAMVVALVALVVALGGTGYAAFVVPNNSVGTKQLKNSAVTGSKIKNRAVTAKKINTSGLTVPNATNAKHAANAAAAQSAKSAAEAAAVGHNTVRMIHLNVPVPASGSTPTQLFKLDGLTITHSCESTAGQGLTATASQVGDLKIVTSDEHDPTGGNHATELSDFGPGNGPIGLYGQAGLTAGQTQAVVGRLIWTTPSGRVLTFDFQDDSFAFGASSCTLAGMVLAG